MEVEEDVSNNATLCRLCDSSEKPLVSIFDKCNIGEEIINIINDSLPLTIHKTDSLSKYICDVCLQSVENVYNFKQKCLDVAEKYSKKLNGDADNGNSSDQSDSLSKKENNEVDNEESCKNEENSAPKTEKIDVSTSTDDLFIFCTNCRTEILEAEKVDKEIELCTDLRQAIIESFKKNKLLMEDKPIRTRRKKSQPFYNELEDSTCSSMTEFTNTESSQCFELENDIESSDSDDNSEPPSKRKKLEPVVSCPPAVSPPPPVDYETMYAFEPEYIYNPLKLFSLCIQSINCQIIGEEYWPDRYEKVLVSPPVCSVCNQTFNNRKLLALHEAKQHISIEMTEQVDDPVDWHVSRDDYKVRNKWLKEFIERNEYMKEESMDTEGDEESLLIPVGSDSLQLNMSLDPPRPIEESLTEAISSSDQNTAPEVELIDGRPFVENVPLGDYTKEERRAFYRSLRVGGVVKRFCKLCRYSFKDNWAIEAHYFSMACYFTCRYCGMRFNKQRARFKEHVDQHQLKGDPISTKIFAASKLNNIVPKVVYPLKRQKIVPQIINSVPKVQPIKIKNLQGPEHLKNNMQSEFSRTANSVKVKDEPFDEPSGYNNHQQNSSVQLQTSQSKTGNQAFFCRKCYKVFFKLDEFNIHSRNCEHNQFPNAMPFFSPPSQTPTPPKPQQSSSSSNGEAKPSHSPSGRPVRNCVKEAGPYRDEVYLPEHLLKPEPVRLTSQQVQHGGFICYICNAPFPTIYSRNSHMRIHKAETMGPMMQNPMQNPMHNHMQPSRQQQVQDGYQMSVAHLAQVKQEPLEPEVQIHEQIKSEPDYAGLGPAISITPIPKRTQQPLDHHHQQQQQQQQQRFHMPQKSNQPMMPIVLQNETDRTYKCSSCWEAFANKSHLYFHKKTQCEGSKYPCPFCKKRFGTEAAYSSHIFYSHPE